MLNVKGGATCTCGWQTSPVGDPFEIDILDPSLALLAANAYCDANYPEREGTVFCTGLNVT